MVLANVDGIGSFEIVGLIDFLTESRAGLVNLRSRRKTRAMNETVNVLDPTFPVNEVRNFVLYAYPGGVKLVG